MTTITQTDQDTVKRKGLYMLGRQEKGFKLWKRVQFFSSRKEAKREAARLYGSKGIAGQAPRNKEKLRELFGVPANG